MLSIEDFLLVIEATPTPKMLISRADGVILAANHAACDLLEYEVSFLHEKTTIDLDLWKRTEDRSALMQRLVTESRIHKHRVQWRAATGTLLELSLSIQPLKVAKVDCLVVTLTDQGTEVQLAKHLQALALQSSQGLGTASGLLWKYDLHSRRWTVPHHLWQVLGYQRDALAELDFVQLVHFEDQTKLSKFASSIVAPDDVAYADVRVSLVTQGYRWFRLRRTNVLRGGVDGGPSHLVGTVEDVDEEIALRTQRKFDAERTMLAMTAAGMGSWEAFAGMAKGTVWDAQTYRLYGYDPATARLPHDIITEALSPAELSRVRQWFDRSFNDQQSLSIEIQLRRPDGQLRWLAARGQPKLDSLGQMTSLRGVNWDVTDEHNARDLLQQQRDDLSLLARLLHDQERETHKRLALALHDQLGQTLTAGRLTLDHYAKSQPPGAHDSLSSLLDQAFVQLREVLMDLRPPMLEEQGLAAALENEIHRHIPGHCEADIIFETDHLLLGKRFPEGVEYAFFMIAREALTNALMHAQANLIRISLVENERGLVMNLADDGVGFPAESSAPRPGHLGLIGMRERSAAINGLLSISSTSTDGTLVELTWAPRK